MPTIDGTSASETLTGGAGDDLLRGLEGNDTLNGLGGSDVLDGGAGSDALFGGAGDDMLFGRAGTDTAIYNSARSLYVIAVVDGYLTVTGPDGMDRLDGVERIRFSDQVVETSTFGYFATGSEFWDQMWGSVNGDRLDGAGGADELKGDAGDDLLIGGDGDDRIVGGMGSDVLQGGFGNDDLRDEGGSDQVFGGDGADFIHVQPDGIGPFPPPLPGQSGGPPPRSTAYDILLDGGAGNDRISYLAVNKQLDSVTAVGGDGDDIIDVAFAATTTYLAGAGDDTLKVTIGGGDYTVTTGEGSDLVEMAFAPSMSGADGPTSLRITDFTAGEGGDRLDVHDFLWDRFGASSYQDPFAMGWLRLLESGGATYVQVRNEVGTGYTTLVTLDGVEARTLTSANFTNWTGSGFAPGGLTIIGNAEANVLRGGLSGDVLLGLAGNDVIWGGTGAGNQLQGGLGDDRYILEANDTVVEVAGEGNDTIEARINAYVLALNVENLVFGGTGNFAATGNAQANTITGGAGDDNLRGRGGVDVLHGGAGTDTVDYTLAAAGVTARLDLMRATNDGDGATDTFSGVENLTGSVYNDLLIGNAGNNVLHGGIGTDTLLGFGGDDILWGGSGGGNNQLQGGTGDDYYVLDAFDTCVEFAGEGIDTVEARIGSYTMGANIENLLYVGGTGTFVGTGNTLDNHITGGNGNDILRGRGGNDVINGGLGKDEIQMRGLAGEYTVTAEGAGYRIVDSVAGRDGSTFVESIEVIRWSNNQVRLLSYPPAAASIGEPSAKDGPEVSPLLSPDADAFVLPALGDDLAQVLPGLADGKDGLAYEVLPALADRLFLGLEGHLAHLPQGGTLIVDLDGGIQRTGDDWFNGFG